MSIVNSAGGGNAPLVASPLTILSGATLSNTLALNSAAPLRVQIPATMTGTTIGFMASDDGGVTWYDLYDNTGTLITVTVAAGAKSLAIPASVGAVQLLRLKSGSAEAALRTLAVVAPKSAITPAFTPDQIGGLAYWLDASKITGVADGAALSSWPDASGQAAAATPTAGAGTPTFRFNNLGGQPAVDFSTAWSALVTSSLFSSGFDRAFSLFMVEQVSNEAGAQVPISSASATLRIEHQPAYIHMVAPSMNGSDRGFAKSKRVHIFAYDGATATYSLNGAEISAASTTVMGLTGTMFVGGQATSSNRALTAIGEVAVWQHALTGAERKQLLTYARAKYGYQQTRQAIVDGDSIAVGYFASTAGQWCYRMATALGIDTWAVPHVAIVGQQIAQMLSPALTRVDPLYNAALGKNIVICAAGTNDLSNSVSTTTVYNNIVSYCQARRAAGFKVVVCTILPRSDAGLPASFETWRQTVNGLIKANWATFADALADYGSDATIGVAGASNNATYYSSSDKIHPTDAGHAIIAPYVTTAVNSL